MTGTFKIAIVAALEREVWPLVKDWPTRLREHDGRSFKLFEKAPVVLVCGGIGSEAARRAAEAIVNLYQPAVLVSAGFAGALTSGLQAGDLLTPSHVIDAQDGSRAASGSGDGILITFEGIADAEQKARLADAFGAHAVDMEAAAVARTAGAHGLKFLACKVVSDAHDSNLPPLKRFIDPRGRLHAVSFLCHVAVRPWLWGGVLRLARNSAIAARTLSEALAVHNGEAGVSPVQPGEDARLSTVSKA